MTIEELCAAANRGEPLPDCLQLHDSLFYQAMRHVYKRFHDGDIDLETAQREKNSLIYQHKLWKKQQDFALDSARRYQEITIITEGLRADLRKQIRNQAPPEQIIFTAVKLIDVGDGLQRVRIEEG